MHQPTGEPVVTAIMPTYNHAAFIGQAIESVLAQTFEAWELVVVDDGSADGTPDLARRYRDDRIRVVARDHGGLHRLGEAYRAALEASTAPLVAILEGDDTWPADKLARQAPDFDDQGVFTLRAALTHARDAGLLKTSSDLSRVKVTRHNPAIGKECEWVLNCAPSPQATPIDVSSDFSQRLRATMEHSRNDGQFGIVPDLWLRDGDVIEVPEK